MIIQCESCRAKFKLNEELIKGKGARVRCKKCTDYIIVMKTGYEHLKNQYIESVKDAQIAEKESKEEISLPDKNDREEFPLGGLETPTVEEQGKERSEEIVQEKVEEKIEEEVEEKGEAREADEEREASLPEGDKEVSKDDIDKAFEDFLGTIQDESSSSGEGARSELDTSTFDDEETVKKPDSAISESIAFAGEREEVTEESKREELDLSLEDEKISFQDFSDISETISPNQKEEEGMEEGPVSSPKEEDLVLETPLTFQETFTEEEGKTDETSSELAEEAPREKESGTVKPSPYEYISKERTEELKTTRTKNFLVVLLILLLIIAGIGAYLAFTKEGNDVVIKYAPYLRSMLNGESHSSSKTFSITNLIGYNETNIKEGTIFVIKGDVVNLSKDVKSGLILKGEVMGKKGNLLGSGKVYGGNSLTPGELKTEERAVIEKTLQNKLGKNLANIDIQPGSSIPFMIVFFDLQEKVGSYKVESIE